MSAHFARPPEDWRSADNDDVRCRYCGQPIELVGKNSVWRHVDRGDR